MSRGRWLLVACGIGVLAVMAGYSIVGFTAENPKSAPPEAAPSAKQEAEAKAGDQRFTHKEAILKALEQQSSFEFKELPLSVFVKMLQDKFHIQIYLDKRALNAAGVDESCQITCSLSNIPLRSALNLMLRELDLAWMISDDVLMITDRDTAAQCLETKTYNVADLLVMPADLHYDGSRIPTATLGTIENVQSEKGTYSWPELIVPSSTVSIDYDSLIDTITTTVHQDTWEATGGCGTIKPYDMFFVINQSQSVHSEVDHLLADLRAKRQAMPIVVVDLLWLWLDKNQYDRLIPAGKTAEAGQTGIVIEQKDLDLTAKTADGIRGRISCVNGQLVHLSSGDRRSFVTGALPATKSGDSSRPLVQYTNAGIVLEIRPTIAPGAKTATVQVQSTCSRWLKPEPAAEGAAASGQGEGARRADGSTSPKLDQSVMPTQQMAATVRVPLGKPVLVGAMTFAPSKDSGAVQPPDIAKQLVLIATTNVASTGEK
jgi:hypothetical protein